jgi:hypothetical protein
MKAWPKVALGDLLRRSDESAVLNPTAEYHEVTIKLWGKGVVSRGKVYGSDVVSVRRVVRVTRPERFLNIEIPMPALAGQQQIAEILRRLSPLKAKHTAIHQTNAALLPATLERVFS